MKLVHLEIIEAPSCGGLLDGFHADLYRPCDGADGQLQPLCLLGPNGSGKSQCLQVIAEIFQAAWHTHNPMEERDEANPRLTFRLSYEIGPGYEGEPRRVRLSRTATGEQKGPVQMEIHDGEEYREVRDVRSPEYGDHLPRIVVAYTSGDNETLSLPFFVSRSEYAEAVGHAALTKNGAASVVPDNRLQLIDYGTHLEVLIANLMIGEPELRHALIEHAMLDGLATWRCIVQLNHPRAPQTARRRGQRKGIQLTDELEGYVNNLKRCSTCWDYQEHSETYIFDFFVDMASRKAFRRFWATSWELYRSLHKLAMLNDLMIPKASRTRIKKDIDSRHFAARLPEPQDESKVFRFEEVRFRKATAQTGATFVDYVSLSDGEHQQAQVFGMFAMMTDKNTLFLLDEPESHFNPLWRARFISRLMKLPIDHLGDQEIILTTHAPFIASDISRDQVRVFSKEDGRVTIATPDIETFGATYDRILQHCFGVEPPISQVAQDTIERLMRHGTRDEIRSAIGKLGMSVERALLADRLRTLESGE